MEQLTREELFEQYQEELRLNYGFFAPNRWSTGARDFATFLAARRIETDLHRALAIIEGKKP